MDFRLFENNEHIVGKALDTRYSALKLVGTQKSEKYPAPAYKFLALMCAKEGKIQKHTLLK